MTATAGRLSRTRTWLLYALGVPLLNLLDRVVAFGSAVGDAALFSKLDFAWAAEVEAGWEDVRDEFQDLAAAGVAFPNMQDIAADLSHLTTDDGWKTLFLFGYGHRSAPNCERCPRTTELLARIPGIHNALFSILAPGKRIPRHRGEYKGLIRCHLGLIVPRDAAACRMEVEQEAVVWRAGELVVFDNSRRHEVANDTDETRVVLLFDIVRPMRRGFGWLNRLVIGGIARSPYVRTARENHDRWESEEAARQLVAAGGSGVHRVAG